MILMSPSSRPRALGSTREPVSITVGMPRSAGSFTCVRLNVEPSIVGIDRSIKISEGRRPSRNNPIATADVSVDERQGRRYHAARCLVENEED
jgi:hypothetical protein